jgi:hypothetical protein
MSESEKTIKALASEFANPPAEYGPYPCWWWEGEPVTREKITWQLEEMKKVGTAGTFFYMHYCGDEPYAVVPAYRSDEFYELFRFSLAEHRRLGMEAYFSEWTGAHGVADELARDPQAFEKLTGRVLAKHERVSSGSGMIEIKIPTDEKPLWAGAYRQVRGGLDGESCLQLTDALKAGVLSWLADEAGWRVIVVTSRREGVDWLNPDLADRWLASVWGPYLEKMPEFIGNTFKGYIQDELDVLTGAVPYSQALRDTFIEKNGYDPALALPALFHDVGPETDKHRCAYYGVMSELLERNLYARLSKWHEARDMIYATIAIRGRQDVLAQTSHFGDLFRLLRWYHIPGNEDPQVDAITPDRRRFIDAKISSSAAHIFERRRAGVCTYWGAGWGMTMEENVNWTHENYAYGLNLFDPHLAPLSMGGGWFEWVPPAHYLYQPYWRHYDVFSEYISRLSHIMSQGHHRPDVAILFPTTSIHANWIGGERYTLEADRTSCETYNMAESFYYGGVDFDFIDEDSLIQAEVRDGLLCVAGVEFRAVAIPPMTTIRTATIEKLIEFRRAGGVVMAYQRLPNASAEVGRYDANLKRLLGELFGLESSDGYVHGAWRRYLVREMATEGHFLASTHVTDDDGGAGIFITGEQNRGTNGAQTYLPSVLAVYVELDVRPIIPDGPRMSPRITRPDMDVYHIHRKVGDLDFYYFYNARPEQRQVTLILRAEGNPSLWEAATGDIRPFHRFERVSRGTKVRLHLEPHQALVLGFQPDREPPALMEDNLDEVSSVEPVEDCWEVGGWSEHGGRKRVKLEHQGRIYTGEGRGSEPPTPLIIGGEWSVRYEPTMDNRWGDYRYPAFERMIGPEARRFRYAEETCQSGVSLGWHTAEYDDGGWKQYTYTFGPYWREFGPHPKESETDAQIEALKQGEWPADLDNRTDGTGLYCFSQHFGHESTLVHQTQGGLEGVSENFVVFEPANQPGDVVRILATTVRADQARLFDLVIGGATEFEREAWVNGSSVGEGRDGRIPIDLKEGANLVLLKFVQPEGKPLWAHAAILPRGPTPDLGRPPIPKLKWFIESTDLRYDVRPDDESCVGWFRFEAPPGVRRIRLCIDAEEVSAWIDDESFEIRDGAIDLGSPRERISQVSLRVRQLPGRYAGAAFVEPVSFECEAGRIPLGDWCNHALESYSGGLVYQNSVTLDTSHLQGRVVLDLGRVHTTAEVRINSVHAGVTLARPHRLDISALAREGQNDIEVTVFNTLANHYSIGIPSRFVYEGQTVSGLLGPVMMVFASEVRIVAAAH